MTTLFNIYKDPVGDVAIYNPATNQAEWVKLEGGLLKPLQTPEVLWTPRQTKFDHFTLLASGVPLDKVILVVEYAT